MILAVTASEINIHFSETGFYPCHSMSGIKMLRSAGLWLGPRDMLEVDPRFRQLIPYVLIQVGDRFVRYTRTSDGGEARLHQLKSIGFGGHVDLSDLVTGENSVDLDATLRRAAVREMEEELGDLDYIDREWQGILVENGTEVGRVHIGLVEIWTLRTPPQKLAEKALDALTLCTVDELKRCREQLEKWSDMLLDHLDVTVG